MKNASSPEDVFESLDQNDQNEVNKWREQRNVLIQQRIRDEVQAELETETSLYRESTPFLRVKVHSLQARERRCESAILTIWHPTENHLNLLKEGSSVQISNLSVRASEFDGHLQLTANKRTVIEPFACELFSLKNSIGYSERRCLTMIEVHKLSHSAAMNEGEIELQRLDFDTAGAIVRSLEPSRTQQETILYLTDESQLLLRVHCKMLPYNLRDLFSGKESPIVALCDLRLRAFDDHQQCAVAELGDLSSVLLSNDRVEELSQWGADSTNTDLLQVETCLELGLPPSEQICDAKVGLGYIMGLRSENKSEKLHIQVDCCGYGSQEWELPISVLQDMLTALSAETQTVALSPTEDLRIRRLGILGSIFRARGALWQFQLAFKPDSSSLSRHVVSVASLADKAGLARYYLTIPEPRPPGEKKGQT